VVGFEDVAQQTPLEFTSPVFEEIFPPDVAEELVIEVTAAVVRDVTKSSLPNLLKDGMSTVLPFLLMK
jgi:hypothetical protein